MDNQLGTMKDHEHFVLYAAIIGAALIIMFLSWSSYSSQSEVDLKRAELKVMPRFPESIKHGGIAIRLPDLGVLGPEGDVIKIHENRTKYTFLTLWNYDGPYTGKYLRGMKSLYDRMPERSDWQFYAVSVDDIEDLEKTYNFIADSDVRDIAEYHDYEGVLLEYFELTKPDLPVTFLLDSKNRILYEFRGYANLADMNMVDFLNQVSLNF